MNIFDRPADYDQQFIQPVQPIAPSNPTQNQERGHISEYPQQDKRHVSHSTEEVKKHISGDPGTATLNKVCAMCNQFVEGARISCSKCPVHQLRRVARRNEEVSRMLPSNEELLAQCGLGQKVDCNG